MSRWIGKWVVGWVDGWVNGWVDGCKEWIDELMNGQKGRWINEYWPIVVLSL